MAAGPDQSCRAALEAMAAGRPVVARAVGALPDLVAHGRTGLLLDEDSPDRVADALCTILTDRAGVRRMGRGARRRAETEHSRDRALDIVEAAYAAVLGPPRPA